MPNDAAAISANIKIRGITNTTGETASNNTEKFVIYSVEVLLEDFFFELNTSALLMQ